VDHVDPVDPVDHVDAVDPTAWGGICRAARHRRPHAVARHGRPHAVGFYFGSAEISCGVSWDGLAYWLLSIVFLHRFCPNPTDSFSVYRQKMPRFSYNATRLPSVHCFSAVMSKNSNIKGVRPCRIHGTISRLCNKSPRSGVHIVHILSLFLPICLCLPIGHYAKEHGLYRSWSVGCEAAVNQHRRAAPQIFVIRYSLSVFSRLRSSRETTKTQFITHHSSFIIIFFPIPLHNFSSRVPDGQISRVPTKITGTAQPETRRCSPNNRDQGSGGRNSEDRHHC